MGLRDAFTRLPSGQPNFADCPTMSSMPPICGSSASKTSRSIAKSLPVGCSAPWVAHATIRDRSIGLRVRRLSDRQHGSVQCLTPFVDRRFALAAELADRLCTRDHAPPLRRRVRPAPSELLVWCVTHAHVSRRRCLYWQTRYRPEPAAIQPSIRSTCTRAWAVCVERKWP
jgi:hypothetical protein